ncbi:MAG: hypothetical protein LBU14_05510 [Candidatus Peribacteria bacterium]|jgi:hypothetical protein|nr:hypothetical protein [Candidatus Peribacteria bacterium]
MYKDYLQDILQNIKFKVLTSKDERYETQIGIMQSELEYLENLTKYLDFLGNYDELKNLNLNELLDKIIVSEEKIAKT